MTSSDSATEDGTGVQEAPPPQLLPPWHTPERGAGLSGHPIDKSATTASSPGT